MNIQSVSSKSNNTYTPLTEDKTIELLNKQKMQLQDQMQKVNGSKLDSKTKQERIKQLQDQIQQIDMEIQQIQAEKVRKSQKKNENQQASTNKNVEATSAYSTSGISDLVQASATYSKAKIMNSVKTEFEGRARVLKIEIKQDEAKSMSTSTGSKRQELSEVEARVQMLDDSVDGAYKKVQEQVKNASERLSDNKEEKDYKDNNEIDDKKETDNDTGSTDTNKTYRRVDVKV